MFVAAAGSDGIFQLSPVPFDQQAKALADRASFDEALAMLAYLDESQVQAPLVMRTLLIRMFLVERRGGEERRRGGEERIVRIMQAEGHCCILVAMVLLNKGR